MLSTWIETTSSVNAVMVYLAIAMHSATFTI